MDELDEFVTEMLEQKLSELMSEYEIEGEEGKKLRELLRDLQHHAYDTGVYAVINRQDSEDNFERDVNWTLDRETLVKLILSTEA